MHEVCYSMRYPERLVHISVALSRQQSRNISIYQVSSGKILSSLTEVVRQVMRKQSPIIAIYKYIFLKKMTEARETMLLLKCWTHKDLSSDSQNSCRSCGCWCILILFKKRWGHQHQYLTSRHMFTQVYTEAHLYKHSNKYIQHSYSMCVHTRELAQHV